MIVALSIGAILAVGPALSRAAEVLSGRLGIGDAIGGAVFLGIVTSLSGTVVSVSAAARGDAPLALSDAMGGIAAQTAFLAVADFLHRRANLEHDSASVVNLFQLALLGLLLSLVMLAMAGGGFETWRVHPVSVILPVAWIVGTLIARQTGKTAPWKARITGGEEQHRDGVGATSQARGWALSTRFALLASIVGPRGWGSRCTPPS